MNTPPSRVPTVLIVEDNEEFLTLLQRFLEPRYRVLRAGDGEEGLRLALAEHPQVILTDVLMPRMDGIELLRRLRENPETSDLPVVVLLATASPEDLHAAERLRASTILPKETISRAALLEILENLLAQTAT